MSSGSLCMYAFLLCVHLCLVRCVCTYAFMSCMPLAHPRLDVMRAHYVCMYMYICMYIYIHTHTYIHTHSHTHSHTHTHAHTHTHTHTHEEHTYTCDRHMIQHDSSQRTRLQQSSIFTILTLEFLSLFVQRNYRTRISRAA